MVILLPGIMGSVLQKDGRDLWALSGKALWQHMRELGASVNQLRVAGEEWQSDDLGDGIRAVRLIEDLHSLGPLGEHAGYSVIRHGLKDFFGLTEGIPGSPEDSDNFFPFPYDWRRDNRVSARKLQKFIEQQLPRWREWSGSPTAKVILIGHSMGGLVARYYLEVLGGWRDCEALLTIGSPHRGAIGALDTLSNGFSKFNVRFNSLSQLVQGFPSAYQLLPTYAAVEAGNGFVRPGETSGIPNVDPALASAARQDFLDAIRRAAIENAKDPAYSQRTIPWIGTRQDTAQSARVLNGKLVPSYNPPPGLDPALSDGDGTVPRLSAVPADLDGRRFERFSVERHGWLTNNDMTLKPLLETLLQISSPSTGQFFGIEEAEEPDTAISLRLESMFLPDEPASVQVKLANNGIGERLLQLQVRPVGHQALGTSCVIKVTGDELARVEFGELAPGLYELTASPQEEWQGAPPPVHGAFEVLDPAAID
jgi:pimeloyl-ACP methyl ester carboxylesterase